MPFKSSAQMRGAFGGYLGPEMESKASEFAHATPNIKNLPAHVARKKDNRVHHGGKLADLLK